MPELPDTSHSLISRVKDLSDGASWAEFVRIYQPVVFRMARRRGLQHADAEDVIQQVFVSISGSIDRWTTTDGAPPFRAWLTTVARNAITRALTRRPRDLATGSTSVADVLDAQTDSSQLSAELLVEARREVVLWAAEQIQSEFSADTWAVFWRTSVEGVSIADMAAASGRSAGAIYVARFRVISRLKKKVSEVSHHWEIDRGSES